MKGNLQQNTAPAETADDEVVVKNSTGGRVAVINLVTGNMFISGTLFQNQIIPAPPALSNDFVIKAPDGNPISYIDEWGNFFLNGTLVQNGNP